MTPPAAKQTAPRRELHETEETGPGNRRGWKTVPLGEVVQINPRIGKDELPSDLPVSFIPMKCVKEETGFFQPLEDRRFSDVCRGYTSFRDRDVIFAKVTPCMENGKAALLKDLTNGVGFGSTEFFALRPANNLDANFLFYFIIQQNFRQRAAQNMTGAVGLRRVPKNYLEQQELPLPPLPEQRQIVSEIEKQFTRLDAGVGALKRVQANLKRYRAAVLKAACSGQLVPTEAELWRKLETGNLKPEFETGAELLERILIERRKNWQGRGKYKEPAAPDTSNLPPLPEGWTWATVGQLGEATTGFTPPKCSENSFGGDIPFFKPTDLDAGYYVREFRDSLTESGAEHGRLLPERSILVTCIGATIGKTGFARVRCATNQQINALTVPPDLVLPEFAYWVFSSPLGQEQIKENASATTLPILNKSKFEALAFPLPLLAEQTRIVAEVERRLSVVEELEAVVSTNLKRTARLRQAILKKAFSGELIGHDVSCPSSSCPAAGQVRAKERV